MVIAGYYILDKNPYLVFATSYILNLSVYLLQFYNPAHLRIKNLTKMIFFKTVATSFNLADGKSIKTKDKEFSKRQKTCYLIEKPTLFEWLAYCFTPFGAISASFYEFKLFESILDVGKNQVTVSKESKAKSIDCLKQSFMHFAVYYAFRDYLRLSFYQSDFFLSLNFFLRFFIVLFLGIINYSLHFMQWKAVDAGLYEVGIFDNIQYKEDEFTSLSFYNLLSKTAIKEFGKAYNHTTKLFWTNYWLLRGHDSGLSQSTIDIITPIIKQLLIGPYAVYLLSPFEKKLYLSAEAALHTLAPILFENNFWPFYIFTQAFMIASKTSVRLKTVYSFFYVNSVIYCFFWIAASVIIIIGFFVSKKVIVKNDKNIKID